MNPRLLATLIAVESSGDNLALGDHGRSLGPLQITRVAYMNHLRSIIGRPGRSPAIPRNKLDVPLVSDFDCMDANLHEHVEAILRARKLWQEEKP